MTAWRSAASGMLIGIAVPGTCCGGFSRNASSVVASQVSSDALSACEYPKRAEPAFLPTTPPRPGPCAGRSVVEWQTAHRCSKMRSPASLPVTREGDGRTGTRAATIAATMSSRNEATVSAFMRGSLGLAYDQVRNAEQDGAPHGIARDLHGARLQGRVTRGHG